MKRQGAAVDKIILKYLLVKHSFDLCRAKAKKFGTVIFILLTSFLKVTACVHFQLKNIFITFVKKNLQHKYDNSAKKNNIDCCYSDCCENTIYILKTKVFPT